MKELKKFMEKFNNFTPNLRFTFESSEKSISFLDLIITVSDRELKTTLHMKSTDHHQYLHYASSHPEHAKRSVVFSQTLRISRLCSEENNFKSYRSHMRSWFLKHVICCHVPPPTKKSRKNNKSKHLFIKY